MIRSKTAALLLLALLGVSGPVACKKFPPAVKSETQEEGKEKDEEESADRVKLSPEAIESLKLVLATAEETDLSPALEVAAELVPDPDRRADVGTRTAARVVEFRVKVGDRVEKGSSLVVVESAEVGKARAELHAARAKAEVARQAATRERALLAARATSQREVLEADALAKTTEADVASLRAVLVALGAPEEGGSDPARFELRSPVAGTVVARPAQVGQSVEPSTTLVQVVNLDRLWLEAQVYEREMRFVAPGQPVQLEARAFPGEVFRGKVDRVGDVLDEKTRAVPVRVLLPNPGHRLKPGMFATARIIGTRANEPRRMLAIPWAAIQEIDGHLSVFVRKGEDEFELRRVHTGERAGDLVEILNGVARGDVVVAEGSFLLKGELLKSTLGEEE